MPYQSTWNSPYLQQGYPYQTGQAFQQQPQGLGAYQQPYNGVEKVSGKDSLWQLPMGPNSTSKPYFNVNGKTFYIVTTDAAGAKTIEEFDYSPHVEKTVEIDGAQFVSRQEYDQFVARVGAALEALNGVHGAVPAGSTAQSQGEHGNAEVDDAGRPDTADSTGGKFWGNMHDA